MFELTKCDLSEAWDRFLQTSPQQNVFSTTAFLSTLEVHYDAWFLTDSGTPVLGALIIEPLREDLEAPYEFSLYQGVFFAPGKAPIHRETRFRLSAIEEVLAQLSAIYSSLSFCLHPTIGDLRAIQWFNYHTPEQGRYAIHLNYTGIIDLETVPSFSAYLAGIRKVRMQEYNKAYRQGYHVQLSNDLDVFRGLYIKTFGRQGIVIDKTVADRAVSIAKGALEGGYGRLFLCCEPSGKPASATMFLFDKVSLYYMFGASDPSCRNTGASTFLLLESIKYFYDLGFKKVDMVGINSPNRGDFKTSFNAVPTPYFYVTWRRPINNLSGQSQ